MVLGERIYGYSSNFNPKPLIEKYLQSLSHEIGNLDANIKEINLRDEDNRVEIKVEGADEEFFKNLLMQKFGAPTRFHDIRIGDVYWGYLVDVKKVGFGVFVDCGIKYPTTDILIDLNTLRNQLCFGKKIPLRRIVDLFGFIENFPLYVEIEEISRTAKNIRGVIAKESLETINNWFQDNLERVFVSGSTRAQVKRALAKMGHSQDIVSIKKLGFLEHIILLKAGTNAPGIIAHIGKKLEFSKLSSIRPSKINNTILGK